MILPLPRKFGQLLKQVDLERYGTWSALVSALKRAGRRVFILSLSHFIHVLVRDFWRQIRTPFTKCVISRHWVLYLICSLKWIKVKKISTSTKKSLSKSIKPIPSYDFTKIILWIKAPDWSTRKNSQSDWLENWLINFGAIFYGFFSLISKYLNNEKWSWPDFFLRLKAWILGFLSMFIPRRLCNSNGAYFASTFKSFKTWFLPFYSKIKRLTDTTAISACRAVSGPCNSKKLEIELSKNQSYR